MSPSLPLCADLAWWADAWLRGDVALADVVHRAGRHSPVHSTVAVSPGPWAPRSIGLAQVLLELQDAGAVRAACALPVPARMNGLAGPSTLNRDALDTGEALLLLGSRTGEVLGVMVPRTVGAGTTWNIHHAAPRPPGDLAEADRVLRRSLLDLGDRLASLDVASWSPDTVDVLMNLGRAVPLEAPGGVPEQARSLAARSVWLLDVVDAALEDGDGAAVSAAEAMERRNALDALATVARAALVAACSGDAWPS